MRKSNWTISPGRGENKKYLKPPARSSLMIHIDLIQYIISFVMRFLNTPSRKNLRVPNVQHVFDSGPPPSKNSYWILCVHDSSTLTRLAKVQNHQQSQTYHNSVDLEIMLSVKVLRLPKAVFGSLFKCATCDHQHLKKNTLVCSGYCIWVKKQNSTWFSEK